MRNSYHTGIRDVEGLTPAAPHTLIKAVMLWNTILFQQEAKETQLL